MPIKQTSVDAVEQQQLVKKVREFEQLAQFTLDGLSAHIAVLDANGVILAVNQAWRQFANDNPPVVSNVLEGTDYLAVCDGAIGSDAAGAAVFASGLRAVLGGKRPFFEMEYPCHSPDEKRWFIGRVTRFPDEHGLARAIVAHENITARKLAELNLSKYSRAVEEAPVSILFTDTTGTIEYVNPKLTELTGYAADEMLGQQPSLFKSGHTTDAEYQQLWGAITSGKDWHGEFLNRKKDGTLFWESASISPLKDESGNITNFIAIKKDITKRKKAAAILTESEQRYKALFENASDAIFVNDINGRILDANTIACQRLGYNMKELREMEMADIDPLEYAHLKPDRANTLEKGGYAFFETIHMSKKGKIIPTEINVRYFKYGEQKALLSIARDITERNKVIQAERGARRFAEALAKTAVIINNTLDPNQVLKAILNNVINVVNYEMATIMLIDNDSVQIVEARDSRNNAVPHELNGTRLRIADFSTLTHMMETKEPLVLPLVTKYSGWAKTSLHQDTSAYVGAPICTNGEVLGFINLTSSRPQAFSVKDADHLQAFADQVAIAIKNARLFAEVEKQKTSLEKKVQIRTDQLKHEKEVLEAILFSSPNNILFVNLNHNIEMVNEKFYNTFNLAADDVLGQQVTAVLTIQDQANLEEKLAALIRTHQHEQMETVAILKDGSKLDVEITIVPVKNGILSGIVYTIRDTTSFKKAERAKDTFVSNVSHELKSPITSLKLNHGLLRKKPQNADHYLSRLERETERLNQMVDDMLCLSRLDQNRILLTPSRFDLNQLVSNLIDDRRIVAESNNLTLKVKTLEQLPLFYADARLIEQAISIIITNAINYTPSGGRILVSIHQRNANGVDQCGVRINDTGIGVAPDEQTKIFERFYRGNLGATSTAPGTGLGLAIAAEIVAMHQGEIEVQSDGEPGKGSTFTIWIPNTEWNRPLVHRGSVCTL